MAAKFAKGGSVRIAHPLDGVVEQVKYDEDTGEPRYLVSWDEGDGAAKHHRWFTEAELIEVPA